MPRGIGDAIARAAASDPGDPGTEHGAWEAIVSSVSADGLVVTLPGYHPGRDYGPCPYVAPGGTPQPGDAAIAVFNDQDRDPWILVAGLTAPVALTRAGQSVPDSSFQTAQLDTADPADSPLADLTNHRVVIDRDGWWAVTAYASYGPSAAGVRSLELKAGPPASLTTRASALLPGASGIFDTPTSAADRLYLDEGDVLMLTLLQNSGGPLNVSSRLTAQRVA